MQKTIYEDVKRTIRIEGYKMVFIPKVQGKSSISIDMSLAKIVEPNAKMRKFLPNGGRGFIAIPFPAGGMQICVGEECRSAIEVGIAEWKVEHERAMAEGQRVSNLPETVDRLAVNKLLNDADRLENSPSEDNVSGPNWMRARARALLEAWKLKYPEAAKAELKRDLEGLARKQDSLAIGALLFDADGSFSSEYQEQRAAEFRAKAAEYRARAAAL